LDQCLEWLPSSALQATWRVGERQRHRVATTSGFNLLLAEGDDAQQVVETAWAAFSKLAVSVGGLVRDGGEAELDFGVVMDPGDNRSLRLRPELLACVQQTGASIVVSAYAGWNDE
jgi:hypothetical protein